MKSYKNLYQKICSFSNLLNAFYKAYKGKKNKPEVIEFFFNYEFELMLIQEELLTNKYQPDKYKNFYVYEPKKRHICAASFRDRIVHHSICNILEPIFEKIFIYDSFACRKNKGHHRAVKRVQSFCRKRKFFLKTDIRKFFPSVDHYVLKQLLLKKINDPQLINLMNKIIEQPLPKHPKGKGLPIGNLTSQWWANYYLNTLDHYIKDELGIKYYVRYMDDIIILDNEKENLQWLRVKIVKFLEQRLLLELKDSATYISPVHQGISYLGFRIFPQTVRLKHESLLRFKRKYQLREEQYIKGEIDWNTFIKSTSSLIGHIKHANTYKVRYNFFYKN